MKKYIVSVIAIIITVILAVTGFSATKEEKIQKELLKTEQKITKKLNKAFKTKDMEKLLRKNNLYEDEIIKNMTDYINLIIEYNVSDKVIDVFIKEVKEGKDLDKLIKIYMFLYMANRDYSLIEKMYSFGEMNNFKNDYWVEDAYNKATNYIGGILNEEEIVKYLDKGLTYEDISVANKLCFKGKMKINEILDEILKGKSWIDIINKIYPDLRINKLIYNTLKPSELYNYVRDAVIHEENINEMYDKNKKKKAELFEQKEIKHYKMIEEELKNNNISFNDLDKLKYAKENIPELTEKEIKSLIDEDFLIKEIKRGIKISKEKGISIKRAIETDYKREGI